MYITVSEKDHGIGAGEEDFVFFDRNNVVTLFGSDGTIGRWDKMCLKLKLITGDEYDGGWKLL